jgi:hypothetical protein
LPSAGGSFENFIADMGECPPGKTLDRIDTKGNYAPENCRWATPKERRANQRKRTTDLEGLQEMMTKLGPRVRPKTKRQSTA